RERQVLDELLVRDPPAAHHERVVKKRVPAPADAGEADPGDDAGSPRVPDVAPGGPRGKSRALHSGPLDLDLDEDELESVGVLDVVLYTRGPRGGSASDEVGHHRPAGAGHSEAAGGHGHDDIG